jgi:hypothetical protein
VTRWTAGFQCMALSAAANEVALAAFPPLSFRCCVLVCSGLAVYRFNGTPKNLHGDFIGCKAA